MLRLWPRLAAVALAVVTAAPVMPAHASPQDELAGKRARAEQLEAEIAANGERISILDEEYNQARLAVEQATAAIAQAEVGLADAEARARDLTDQLAGRAAQMYIEAGAGALTVFNIDAVREIGVRETYGEAAAESDQLLIDNLDAASEDLAIKQAELERQRDEAQSRQDSLGSMREQLEGAQADQEALLASVEGDIADLVAEIEAQRQREEEERARQELERKLHEEQAARVAREAAARATSTTRASGGTGTTAPAAEQAAPRSKGPAPPDVPAPNANAQIAVDAAKAQIGKPYQYAADGPDEFDCSGLTQFAWAAAGVSIPHSSQAQYDALPHVSMDELAPGDLVFYGSPIHHVGIYVGDSQYVHAPQTGDVVKVSSIYRRDYTGAARPG